MQTAVPVAVLPEAVFYVWLGVGLIAALFNQRLLIGLALLSTVVGPVIARAFAVPGMTLADEALILLCVGAVTFRRIMTTGTEFRPVPGWPAWLGFAACGLVSSLLNGVPFGVAIAGGFLLVKGVMLAWAAAQLDWGDDTKRGVKYLGAILVGFLLAGAAVQMLSPEWTRTHFSSGGYDLRSTFAFQDLHGFFSHPSFLGQMLAMSAIGLVAMRREGETSSYFLALVAVLAAVLTFRRKTWVSMPIGLLQVLFLKKRFTALVLALLLLPVGVATIGRQVYASATQSYGQLSSVGDVPRAILYRGSVDIAAQGFPFGAGFGRWGSFTAIQNYSPEYVKRGLEAVDGFRRVGNTVNYSTDTFWPTVLGESGVLGLVCYLAGLLMLTRSLARGTGSASSWTRVLAMSGLGWLWLLLIESIAAPVFTGPPTYPWLFVVAAVVSVRVAAETAADPEVAAGAPVTSVRTAETGVLGPTWNRGVIRRGRR